MSSSTTVTVNMPNDSTTVTVNVGNNAPVGSNGTWVYGSGNTPPAPGTWIYGSGSGATNTGTWIYGTGGGSGAGGAPGTWVYGSGTGTGGNGSGNTVTTGAGTGDAVFQYQSLPLFTSGDDIADWVNDQHGVDGNGDGAYNVGVVISNLNTVTILPASNDTAPYDGILLFELPRHGAATLLAQSVTYQPSVGFVGIDTIGYTLVKDGVAVATATIFIGVYGSQAPADTFPSYDTIPLQTVVMDQCTEISLSQFVDLGTVDFQHLVINAIDVAASIDGAVLSIKPNSNLHSLGLGKITLHMVSPDGSVIYDTVVITVDKISDDSFIKAEICLLINGEIVDSWIEEAYAPEKITQRIQGSYGGIAHNNEPVKAEVLIKRLDQSSTEHLVEMVGSVIIREVVTNTYDC